MPPISEKLRQFKEQAKAWISHHDPLELIPGNHFGLLRYLQEGNTFPEREKRAIDSARSLPSLTFGETVVEAVLTTDINDRDVEDRIITTVSQRIYYQREQNPTVNVDDLYKTLYVNFMGGGTKPHPLRLENQMPMHRDQITQARARALSLIFTPEFLAYGYIYDQQREQEAQPKDKEWSTHRRYIAEEALKQTESGRELLKILRQELASQAEIARETGPGSNTYSTADLVQIIQLRLQNRTYEQIAEKVGGSPTTVGETLRQGLARIEPKQVVTLFVDATKKYRGKPLPDDLRKEIRGIAHGWIRSRNREEEVERRNMLVAAFKEFGENRAKEFTLLIL